MNAFRLVRLSALVLTCMSIPSTVQAKEPINTTLVGSKAIKGYDPVAYFVEGKPVEGKKEFQYAWKGANWYFSSAKNLDLFKASPEKYAPQYGGYCAYAMSLGNKAGIDPAAWTIANDKLYLNYDLDIKKKWESNRADYITKADQKWSELIK